MEKSGSKPRLGRLIPPFSLKSADGKLISAWDYKEKNGLVIVFFNPRNSEDLEALAEINHRYHEITDENGQVLAIGSGSFEELSVCASGTQFQFPLLSDSECEAAQAFDVSESTFFVADRFGELRMRNPLSKDLDAALTNAIGSLNLAELECPECSVSSWPEE